MELSEQVLNSIVYETRKVKGWLKFLGIVFIVSGGLQALTIVGILVAWLPIWMGVLLLQAGKFADSFLAEQNPSRLVEMFRKLRIYFVVQGILIIVSLALVILLIFYLIIGISLFGIMSQEMGTF